MDYDLISQLQISNRQWKIKAKILRLWDSINHNQNELLISVDAYIIDEKGDNILVTITPENAEYFRAVLHEGDVYFFSNFSVFPVRNTYRPCPNKYMLKFDKRTKIQKAVDAKDIFPPEKFHFISFDEMESRIQNKVYLTDMIGQIVNAGNLQQVFTNNRMVHLRKIEFEDEMLNSISATLWGQLAMEFDEQKVFEKTKTQPVIIICAGMTVTTFSGKTILSSISASRVYIDLKIPEVDQLKKKIIQPRILQIIPSTQATITNPIVEMKKNRKTVAELLLLDMKKDAHQKFTCRAKIKNIDVTDGWWYPSCPTCGSATKPYEDANLCSLCSVINEIPIPRYILNATIMDETGEALFTFFERQAEKMIGISAATIASMEGSNRYVLPQIITDVFPMYRVFQVMINQNNKRVRSICFKVSSIYDDKIFSQITSGELAGYVEIGEKVTQQKSTIDVLSQESGISDTFISDQIIGLESDIQVHTPQKSRSNIRRRQVNQLKLEDSDASLSDNELISMSLQHKGKQKNRGTMTIREPQESTKKQKKADVHNKNKGKKPAD
ncbi:replication protein A 70 kDa DNA-binding subunit-like isoform X2 [Tripterygium wilfordii]|uniref:replication protein A 70 kDa DNA-binding subunit-like isoform X2 n=1 Tax=Tripterygium wilfordii TaxID=458696 RepID=UPI0018F8281F|nr:replication protein A 70 kDa DNA-binding subunit-like isoform X2 [Tripterygium wilfordii]